MKKINTFFERKRELQLIPVGKSRTVPNQALDLKDLLKNGDLDTITERIRKRMIYGERVALKDLTDFDHMKRKIDHLNMIMNQGIDKVIEKVDQPDKSNEVKEETPQNKDDDKK